MCGSSSKMFSKITILDVLEVLYKQFHIMSHVNITKQVSTDRENMIKHEINENMIKLEQYERRKMQS